MAVVVSQLYVLDIKIGVRKVPVSFQLNVHIKEQIVLEKIKDTLGGVGEIHKQGNQGCVFIVSSALQLANTIIPHYDNYPLMTKKRAF